MTKRWHILYLRWISTFSHISIYCLYSALLSNYVGWPNQDNHFKNTLQGGKWMRNWSLRQLGLRHFSYYFHQWKYVTSKSRLALGNFQNEKNICSSYYQREQSKCTTTATTVTTTATTTAKRIRKSWVKKEMNCECVWGQKPTFLYPDKNK